MPKKSKLKIYPRKCIHCLACLTICPYDVLLLEGHNIKTDKKLERKFCSTCKNKPCVIMCPTDALEFE